MSWWESVIVAVVGIGGGAVAGRWSKRGEAIDKRKERVETHAEAAAVAHEKGRHDVQIAEVAMVPRLLDRIEKLEDASANERAECREQLDAKDSQIAALTSNQDVLVWLVDSLTNGASPEQIREHRARLKPVPETPPRRESPPGGMLAVRPSDPPHGSD